MPAGVIQNPGQKPIVENPYAKDLIVFKMNDQGQITLESKLPPLETSCALMQMAFRTTYTYIDLQVERLSKEIHPIERV